MAKPSIPRLHVVRKTPTVVGVDEDLVTEQDLATARRDHEISKSIARNWLAALDDMVRARAGNAFQLDTKTIRRQATRILSDRHVFHVPVLYRMAADLVAHSHPMELMELLGPRSKRPRRPPRRTGRA